MTKHDDETSRRAGVGFVVAGLCLLGFPLLGVYLDGQSLSRYAEFPPQTRYVGHASFSWTAFVLLAAFCVAVVTPFLLRVIRARHQARPAPARRYPFPAWGWLGVALIGIGVWPDYLFPLLWLSPLFIITSLQALGGRPTIFTPIAQGDWSRICRLALATLVCGLFWEMWNINSLPKWVYSVPFVDRFHVFEMPILGFAGYLPFGLECAVIAHFVRGPSE